MAHRDALAVEAQHQQVAGRLGLTQPVRVELVEVLRRSHRQLLDLPLGHAGPGALPDQLDHLVKRRLPTLLGDDATYLERVLLLGQPERGVEGRDRRHADRPIQLARHQDFAERRLHRAGAGSRVRARDSVRTDDAHRLFRCAPRVDVRLQQPTDELRALLGEQPLDVRQRRAHRLGAGQLLDQVVHATVSLAERAVVGDPLRACCRHQVAHATRSRSIRIAQPCGIDQVSLSREDPHPGETGRSMGGQAARDGGEPGVPACAR